MLQSSQQNAHKTKKSSHFWSKFSLLSLLAMLVLVGGLSLSACSQPQKEANDSTKPANASTEKQASFPIEFKNADGSVTKIEKKPERIVSTSVTLTGMAVPLKAPIVASATAINSDFFPAWKKEADSLGVKKLWKAQSPADLEAIAAEKPDLILVSSLGADSVKKQFEELKKIAPTVLIDYSNASWQDVTKELGKLFGLEKETDAFLKGFDDEVKQVASKIKHPEGSVNIISYNGATRPNGIALVEGPYGQLFTQLGFKVEEPKKEWSKESGEQGNRTRTDFLFTSLEHLSELSSPTTFLIRADEGLAKQMSENPVLANLPSVKAKQVFPLGKQVFRLDYYSSKLVLQQISKLYAK